AGVRATSTGAHIRSEGEDCEGGGSLRDAACAEPIVDRAESHVTIGANRDTAKALFIELIGERQADDRGGVIGVVTGIDRPRDHGAGPYRVEVIQARCWTGCWARRNCRRGGGRCRRCW